MGIDGGVETLSTTEPIDFRVTSCSCATLNLGNLLPRLPTNGVR